MKNKVYHFSPGWRHRIASVRHRCICYFIGGGGLLFLGVFVVVFGLPIWLIELVEKKIKRRKHPIGTMDEEGMSEELQIQVESKILVKDFYMRDFANDKEAAEYLGISTRMWIALMQEWNTTLPDFIYTMRLEDVKDYLEKHPDEPLEKVAEKYGFTGQGDLQWHFFKREKCLPERWMSDNLIKLTQPEAAPESLKGNV